MLEDPTQLTPGLELWDRLAEPRTACHPSVRPNAGHFPTMIRRRRRFGVNGLRSGCPLFLACGGVLWHLDKIFRHRQVNRHHGNHRTWPEKPSTKPPTFLCSRGQRWLRHRWRVLIRAESLHVKTTVTNRRPRIVVARRTIVGIATSPGETRTDVSLRESPKTGPGARSSVCWRLHRPVDRFA